MNDFDDHVIPYEDAVRRHRALKEAQRQKGIVHEVKISDAMSHLLEEEGDPGEDVHSPAALRRIVERDFADEDGGNHEAEATGGPRERKDARPDDQHEAPLRLVEEPPERPPGH